MKKQEFLDKEPATEKEKLMQLVLTIATKTEVTRIATGLRQAERLTFKSQWKQLPFEEIADAFYTLENMLANETTEAPTVDGAKQVRRR